MMPVFFLIMSYSDFIAIIRRVLKVYFAWIHLKADYSKKTKNKKIASTVLFVSWSTTYQWEKIIENCNSVGAGAHKVGKVVRFWPNFDLILQIFRERKKGKFYMLKKVDLRTFKEI